eukprot:CAMPEP_0201508964 /NCGR_PEP_ID=MMETSP0161_2-20130828/2134_1 /ASSEMBLY_ACC=CAM_ASM_000251 /TAXON_ID=180227 /ORGANISM="Neoparamoeba aestuarina, Strain SoJaBio B1-5/56/2" /LENGTH=136 /DNA_ID=CAMNT_0047903771 /DNA_START=204 /DNA_END=614 /DNA_ORIENTATION=-
MFVLNRPHSLPGGKWEKYWPGYENYIKIDKRYGDVTDGVGIVQSFMNAAEVALTLVAWIQRNTDLRAVWLCVLISAVLTFWKTVLYMGADLILDWEGMAGVPQFDFYAFYFLPSIFWIIFPFLVTTVSLNRIYNSL